MTTARPNMPPESGSVAPSAQDRGSGQARAFERNTELEELLARINGFLSAAENAQPEPPPPQYPLILLVGAPRSGTTLFMQWLHATGQIAVPTNLISRFYAAPAFGVMLQRLMFDARYRYRDEFDLPVEQAPEFGSALGKTKGMLGHNSFFFFWRQFFPLAEPSALPEAEVPRVDGAGLKRAIARFASELGMPLAMKGYLVQYHLRLLESILDRVLFVHITRDPLSVMASLLAVRRQLYGDEGKWWGCRPPGIEALMDKDPAVQVAGQIALTERSIRSELATIPARKQMEVRYEELCDAPAGIWSVLREKVIGLSAAPDDAAARLDLAYRGPVSFDRPLRDAPDHERLLQAWALAGQG